MSRSRWWQTWITETCCSAWARFGRRHIERPCDLHCLWPSLAGKGGTCTLQAAVTTMEDFQAAQRRHVSDGLPLEMLCAVINNNVRCYDESLEFAEGLEARFAEQLKGMYVGAVAAPPCPRFACQRACPPQHTSLDGCFNQSLPRAGSLDVEGACRGFLELAKEGVAACTAVVFADPAFAELFTRLYCSEEWRNGGVTASVLATLEDFLQDFERMVLPPFFRRCSKHASRGAAAGIMARVDGLRGIPCLPGCPRRCWKTAWHTMWRLCSLSCALYPRRRWQPFGVTTPAFSSFSLGTQNPTRCVPGSKVCGQPDAFKPTLRPLQAARECQPLADVCEFLTADSVESFVLSYTALLTSAPGITPTLLANLINARTASDKHMTKADAREVSCRVASVAAPVRYNLLGELRAPAPPPRDVLSAGCDGAGT